ncbi:hypothetical protein GA0111570_10673 [Raineyella antarctica]|uniref:Uncharacterized protein n=1 Tax=Raineyella antarctica TaxID=1577474 RepID=A0A1G6H2G1_9ACTN|nr:hypothetical protein GA0111570_10673 [Raineyella antarctica]
MNVIAPLLAGPVPLQTLPGWPQVPTITLVDNLVWILFLPLAVFVVIAVIHLAATHGKEDRSLHPPTEPLGISSGEQKAPAVTTGARSDESTGGSHALNQH